MQLSKKGIGIFSFIILVSLTFGSLQGYSGGDKKYNADKAMKEADKLLKAGNIYEAIASYEEIILAEPDKIEALYILAQSYFMVRDYKNSLNTYKEVVDKNDPEYELAKFYYGLTLKMNGKYDEAIVIFDEFKKKYRGKDAVTMKKRVKLEVDGCNLAIEKIKHPLKVDIKNMGTNINAVYMDFAPVIWGDTALSFSSLRSDSLIIKHKKDDNNYLVKMFRAKKIGSSWGKGEEMGGPFKNEELHVANGAFSTDYKRYYFTICEEDKMRKKICQIYVSKLEDGVWQEAEKLGPSINDPKYTSTQPNVGTYKKNSEILYFVSDRDDGEGGLDLWYSLITSKGVYKEPRNLGRKINTPYDEMSPFYDKGSGNLYFSSLGHAGFGGFDIFKSLGSAKKWVVPSNVGYPVNSSVDDMYYVLTSDPEKGFLTSNRTGSIHLKAETCCDDLYNVKWTVILKFALTGNVYVTGDTTMTPIDGAMVNLMSLERTSEGPTQIYADTLSNGRKYFSVLAEEQSYNISASKPGYLTGSATASTIGLTKSDTLIKDIYLQPITKERAYVLRNIYYDFDEFTLRTESERTLDSILLIMNTNPTLIVEIGSHTDSVGTDDYNNRLSQKRAESVVRYLVDHGIPQNRLTAKGYGETEHIARNTNSDGTDNEEGRQLNRRTEFKIIGELDGTLKYIDAKQDLKTGRHKSAKERKK